MLRRIEIYVGEEWHDEIVIVRGPNYNEYIYTPKRAERLRQLVVRRNVTIHQRVYFTPLQTHTTIIVPS